MPGTLFTVFFFTHSNPVRSLHGGCYDYPHFSDDKTETGGLVTCQQQWQVAALGWNPGG